MEAALRATGDEATCYAADDLSLELIDLECQIIETPAATMRELAAKVVIAANYEGNLPDALVSEAKRLFET